MKTTSLNHDIKEISLNKILPHLKTTTIGRHFKYFTTLDSTNTYCKLLAEKNYPEGTIVISEEQTKGRGTKGRIWSSPKGSGLWISILLKPKITTSDISKITLITSCALYETFKKLGINSQIKWPNDMLINNKKVCGILTEANIKENVVNYIILGVGINVNVSYDDFNDDLKPKATSLKIEVNKEIDRCYVLAIFLNYLEKFYNQMINNSSLEYFKIYKENSYILNKTVNIVKNNTVEVVQVLDFDLNGFILVKDLNGIIKKISSAEISLRI